MSVLFKKSNLGELDNIAFRYVYDYFYLTETGMKMSMIYEDIPGNTGVASALIPVIVYHSRWPELQKDDFSFTRVNEYYSMGYCLSATALPVTDAVVDTWKLHLEEFSNSAEAAGVAIDSQSQAYFAKIKT